MGGASKKPISNVEKKLKKELRLNKRRRKRKSVKQGMK